MADSEKVSASGAKPLRVSAGAIGYLSSLRQFRRIPDGVLIRLAERRTRLRVPDRWVAIALLLGNRVPIPIPTLPGQPQRRPRKTTAPAKLEVIIGGRIPGKCSVLSNQAIVSVGAKQ
jgi:hypothetical protein